MGNMFGKPPQATPPPAMPAPTPLPIRDDEAERRAKMKEYAAASKRTGSESTRMSKLGDGSSVAADTRSGSSTPSAVLGAG